MGSVGTRVGIGAASRLLGISREDEAASQLVVVGASAGGIEALSTLVAGLPADFPAPLVIAQHLDPGHASYLGDILGRHSRLPVRTVADRERLTPGVVFVVPPDRHVAITDHEVRLQVGAAGTPKPSVDLLLTSAAQVFGERLLAVVLTGMGSDGAAGARAVHDAGGTVIIQDPTIAFRMTVSGLPTRTSRDDSWRTWNWAG